MASSSPSVPRTADGHPDLAGVWTNRSLTPFQRPSQYARRPAISSEETAAFQKLLVNRYTEPDFDQSPTELALIDGMRRTSLIVDPPDGKLPARTSAARAHLDGLFPRLRNRPGLNNLNYGERCLVPIYAPPMVPWPIANLLQIVQTPDAVMIMSEAMHDVRTIAINASHPSSNVRLWMGDSIAHWDGDVLVVETTNFKPDAHRAGNSAQARATEWFHRLDEDTILYRGRLDDPGAFVKPWTVEYPLKASSEAIYEFACHEGNKDISVLLAEADHSPRGRIRHLLVRLGILVPGHGLNLRTTALFVFAGLAALCLLLLRKRLTLALPRAILKAISPPR